MKDNVKKDNIKVFSFLSHYLNTTPDFISKDEVDEIVNYGVSSEYAFTVIIAAALGLEIVDNADDSEFFNNYLLKAFHKLDEIEYYTNPYFQNIKVPAIRIGNSELKYERYKPYEGFVCNDIITTQEGRQIPQIGFFETEFKFPAILENKRIWMTITPNEIETMKEPVAKAFGKVLTFGLGLGYFAYMVSEKSKVDTITIVENNADVIQLFSRYILPQFKNRHKIKIIKSDAFEFAEVNLSRGEYDFVFTDLWHDVSDGIEMYSRMKNYEKYSPSTVFLYWIEQSILCYL
ncbi:hypothetical protein J7E85_28380 [Paenibacillus sp. ISL-20]|nr:hypothetical protein [Paenibacillus sp. ISL-20]